jgi:pimeloyl-ACP methyl ester carboxylesterase
MMLDRRVAVVMLLAGCDSAPDGAPVSPPVAEAHAVARDSVRLWYRVVGDGPRTVIVPNALYHGTRLDTLALSGWRVVLYDPRGRGRSDSVPAEKVSLDHNVTDVDVIRNAVAADSAALIGWSGMGMELFVYALRYPHRVTRLVQLAPVGPRWVPWSDSLVSSRRARTDTVAAAHLRARASAGEFAGDEVRLCRELARVQLPAAFGDTSLVHLAPDVCEFSNEWPSRIGPYFGAFLPTLEGFDWRPELSRVAIPRLVIHGERDNTPLAGNQEWVAGQPAARLLVIAGAGHWPHFERPDQTLAAIRVFLGGLWPAGSIEIAAPSSRRPDGSVPHALAVDEEAPGGRIRGTLAR